jgi:hypothetical protein
LLASLAFGLVATGWPKAGSRPDQIHAKQAGQARLAILPGAAADLVDQSTRNPPQTRSGERTPIQPPARVAAFARYFTGIRWRAAQPQGDVLHSPEYPDPSQRCLRGPPDPIS